VGNPPDLVGFRWALAGIGLPLLLLPYLAAILLGMILIGVGTFFRAGERRRGFVGRAATTDRGAASGIYLRQLLQAAAWSAPPSSARIFDRIGWPACCRRPSRSSRSQSPRCSPVALNVSTPN